MLVCVFHASVIDGNDSNSPLQRSKQKLKLTLCQVPCYVQAAIGGWHCLALSAEGQVYCWGGNEYQQCGYVAPEDEQEQQQQQWRISHTTKSDTGQQSGVNGDGNNAAADGYGTPEGGDRRVNGHTFSSGGSSMGVLPRARDILVPRRCMPDLRVKQV